MTAPASTRRSKLPDAGGRFPTAPFDQAARAMKVWDAWYSGDPDALHTFYASEFGPTRPIQYRNGFRGRLARFFWGRPANQATKRLHIPAPADLARTSADLLFSQPPRFVMGEDDASSHKPAQKRLEKLLGGPDTAATLLEAGEVQSALGGTYLKLWWDKDVSDKVELSPVHADCAVPQFRYGKLVAVTFWTIVYVDDKKGVYRHLERYSPGKVEHGLYKGSTDVLGSRIPLESLPDTEWVAEISDDGVIPTGVEGITAAYVPNVRPNRMWRNTAGLASLGRSDFEGLEPIFDALDDAYCVDDQTEILTDHGWVTHDKLSEGDSVMTLNHETGMSEWNDVEAVNRFDSRKRMMLQMESKHHSSLTTPQHRWPVIRPSYVNHKPVFDRRGWATSEDFKFEDRVPIRAPHAELPRERVFTDETVEAVAWFWTEGHIRKLRSGEPGRNVTITQSQTQNPENCDRIRHVLAALFGEPVEKFPRQGKAFDEVPRWREDAPREGTGVIAFHLNATAGEAMQKIAPNRVVRYDFLRCLTADQLKLFIEVSMLADNNGERALSQRSRDMAEAFGFALVLAGYNYSIAQAKGGMWSVHIRTSDHFIARLNNAVYFPWEGMVWCPTTKNGTWLARRNGKMFFTGNSSWMRDLDLGKGRIFIDENMLANNGPGRGATFDIDQEVYTQVRGIGKMADGGDIAMNQFAIRWNEHAQTCAELLNVILRGGGYSAANFSDDALTVTKTATEIESRDRLSERTRDKKINYWKAALQPLAATLIQLDHEVFGTDFTIRDAPEVRFPLRPQANPQAMAGTLSQLRAANLLSIEQGVRERSPNWSGDDVNEEVERIKKEIEEQAQMGMGDMPDAGDSESQYDDYSTDEPG